MRKILYTSFLLPILSLANTITLNQSIQKIEDNSPLINIAFFAIIAIVTYLSISKVDVINAKD